MLKTVQYNKGSIIYFENDIDERIFILQKGVVILSSIDIETGGTNTVQLATGEFFGAKSALGHFPREETATVLQDAIVISMTVQEFEQIFSNNKKVVYKMLRVFSGQLREYHKKTKSLLAHQRELNQQDGMLSVARSFYKDEQHRACMDVCLKYLKLFPNTNEIETVAKLYADAKSLYERKDKRNQTESSSRNISADTGALAHFSLPAFERFQKKYESGQVIICEFEPGDSFYLVQSGEVQLVKHVNGSMSKLDILKPGEFFGEMAILDNSPRSATCMAAGAVQCLEFNKENFKVLVTGNPQIAIILLKLFCKRIYDQKRRVRILTIKDPLIRIYDVFCIYDDMGLSMRNAEKSRSFNIKAQDIVQWTGLSADKVQDELSKLVSKKKLQIFENHMVVTNLEEMRHSVEIKMQSHF
ncbi:MAG: cyclic nucleotide-binding domain-containing protein [Treponemataceae bacterium]|nr:cyclic nucleotide-binding domain-containing protein [Treponemataceae bacterium]